MIIYSEAEKTLFLSIAPQIPYHQHQVPYQLYSALAVYCFINNCSGPNVEALRRGINHLSTGGYRMTEEFEKLISF